VALDFANNLLDNLQRIKLDAITIAPLDINVAQWSEFPKANGKSSD
jgi:hypothetical protein